MSTHNIFFSWRNKNIFFPIPTLILSYGYMLFCLQTTSLKSCCEYALRLHVDDETALYLVSLADQLNAKVLKVSFLY